MRPVFDNPPSRWTVRAIGFISRVCWFRHKERVRMDWHRPEKARLAVCESGKDLVVGCQYWEVRHSSEAGGNLSSILFPHGSGKNVLAAPCLTEVRTFHRGALKSYQTRTLAGARSSLSYSLTGDAACIESESPLMTAEGEVLPATCRHRFEYHPWGYIRQRVVLTFTKPLPDAHGVMIARPIVSPHLNEFGLRPAHTEPNDWRRHCWLRQWHKFSAGASIHDYGAIARSNMPLYFTFLQRGVEGFDWFLGNNIDQWHRQIAGVEHSNEFMVNYRTQPEGYEVRICPLSYFPPRVTLKGTYTFDFFMGLPFVQERVRPLVRAIGSLLVARQDRRGTRFPGIETVRNEGKQGVQLARLHDDGPGPDGLFWRDGAYPPYPPQRMREMDRCLRRCHQSGIRVVPYFSLHEFHPDVPPFGRKAKEWQRVTDAAGRMIHNPTDQGEFGAQMCLASGWLDFRKKTIDVALRHHAFDGIYYDWTMAMPCLHKGHRPYAHWDVEEFIDLLEWTRGRVGPDGTIYLHMSAVPFAIAQNLANSILTFEEYSPARVHPDMFPPSSQYMKSCMQGVLPMEEGGKRPRLFALCALLNHLAPDSRHPEFLKVFKAISRIDFTRYTNFENHRTRAVRTTHTDVRAAVYWNREEAMILLANLSTKRCRFTWKALPRYLGWGRDGYHVKGKGCGELPGLGFKYIVLKRTS